MTKDDPMTDKQKESKTMQPGQKFDEFTTAQLKNHELQWKSDVDNKLDMLVIAVDKMSKEIAELNEVMSIGRGGMTFLFVAAKVMAAFGVIAASVYAIKAWVLK